MESTLTDWTKAFCTLIETDPVTGKVGAFSSTTPCPRPSLQVRSPSCVHTASCITLRTLHHASRVVHCIMHHVVYKYVPVHCMRNPNLVVGVHGGRARW